jgi:hypothetical protein
MMRIPFPIVARTGKTCGPAAPAAMQKFFNRVTLETRDRHLTKNKFIVGFFLRNRVQTLFVCCHRATAKLSVM